MSAIRPHVLDGTRFEPHVWVPVGTQDIDQFDHEAFDKANPPSPTGSIRIHGPEWHRYIIHACGCGEWRLVEMRFDDWSSHVERPR